MRLFPMILCMTLSEHRACCNHRDADLPCEGSLKGCIRKTLATLTGPGFANREFSSCEVLKRMKAKLALAWASVCWLCSSTGLDSPPTTPNIDPERPGSFPFRVTPRLEAPYEEYDGGFCRSGVVLLLTREQKLYTAYGIGCIDVTTTINMMYL